MALHAWTDLRVSDFKESFPNINWDGQLSITRRCLLNG